jgi:hypothetical protein
MTTLDDSVNQLARLLLTSLVEVRQAQGTDAGCSFSIDRGEPISVPGKESSPGKARPGDVETGAGGDAGRANAG